MALGLSVGSTESTFSKNDRAPASAPGTRAARLDFFGFSIETLPDLCERSKSSDGRGGERLASEPPTRGDALALLPLLPQLQLPFPLPPLPLPLPPLQQEQKQ